MASIQPQQRQTSIASFGVMDFSPEATLWDLDPDLVFGVVVLAEPVVKGGGSRELSDIPRLDRDGTHQPNPSVVDATCLERTPTRRTSRSAAAHRTRAT